MKKTFPVNINGSVFYIDEDAYNLLSTYLDQLYKTFPGKEGQEIIADIESRIAELFNERISNGARVIIFDDVNSVIAQMGQPSELAEDNEKESTEQEATNTTTADNEATPPPFTGTVQTPIIKRLYRNMNDKVFGGVFGGLAVYLGWNAGAMRVLYAILAIFLEIWPLAIIYTIAWMIIPAAISPRQILEMNGTPITVGSIGQTILGTVNAGESQAQGTITLSGVMAIAGKLIMACLGFVGFGLSLGGLVIIIMSISGLIAYWGWGSYDILWQFDSIAASTRPIMLGFGMTALALSLLIPGVALIWAACCAIFKARGASRQLTIAAALLEVIVIVIAVVLSNVAQGIAGYHVIASAAGITSFSTLLIC